MFRHLRFLRTGRQRGGRDVDLRTGHRGQDLGRRRLACEPLESRRLLSVSLGGNGDGLLDAPPVVTDVIVRGSDWTDDFLDSLDADGLGHPTAARQGYRIPDGAGQLDSLPWANIDTIVIAFSEDVRVEPADLGLYGVATADYLADVALTPGSFEYDGVHWIATWTLPEPIGADRLAIRLDAQVGGVSDTAGNLLDGEWVNGAGPGSSGDGMMGGDFIFGVNVLPGDGNQDGVVHLADAAAVRAKNLSSPGDGDYSPWFDLDGNAVVDSADAGIVRAGLLDRLTDDQPCVPPRDNTCPVLDGTSADDMLEIVAIDGDSIAYSLNGGPTMTLDGIVSFQFDGGDGDDRVTVYFEPGASLPEGGFWLNGQGNTPSGMDVLEVVGGQFETALYNYVSPNDGAITYSDNDAVSKIIYTGLEPIVTSATATDLTFEFTAGTEIITLSDDLVPGDGFSRISSTLGESVVFRQSDRLADHRNQHLRRNRDGPDPSGRPRLAL